MQKKNILNNYKPKKFYDSIFCKNHSSLPYIDIYVCGFPCQTFSILGKEKDLMINEKLLYFNV